MVLRHLLIASQLQLLDSPPPSPPPPRWTMPPPPQASSTSPRQPKFPHPFVMTPRARDGGGGGGGGSFPVAPSESAGGEASGAALDAHGEGYDGDIERRRRKGVEQGPGREPDDGWGNVAEAETGQNRDWPGTSSDAFEIAVAVLKVRMQLCLSTAFLSCIADLSSWVLGREEGRGIGGVSVHLYCFSVGGCEGRPVLFSVVSHQSPEVLTLAFCVQL